MHGVQVFDTPRHLEIKLHNLSHSIYFSNEIFAIPLHLFGVVSCFSGRIPTDDKISSCVQVLITVEYPEWHPRDAKYTRDKAKHSNDRMEHYDEVFYGFK